MPHTSLGFEGVWASLGYPAPCVPSSPNCGLGLNFSTTKPKEGPRPELGLVRLAPSISTHDQNDYVHKVRSWVDTEARMEFWSSVPASGSTSRCSLGTAWGEETDKNSLGAESPLDIFFQELWMPLSSHKWQLPWGLNTPLHK